MPEDTRARPLERLFAENGWSPFEFQRRTWSAYLDGESGLLHSSTGSGKTIAAFGGALLEAVGEGDSGAGTRVLWLTPLRALAADVAEALRAPVAALGLPWRVEVRTGDTTSAGKSRQARERPETLVTTPESLTLLLTREEGDWFDALRLIVVDEWHELLASKRGVQTELAIARIRARNPGVRIWGLSATLGNLDEAKRTLLGPTRTGVTIGGEEASEVLVESAIPEQMSRFPWSGHLGLRMVGAVVNEVEGSGSTLLFCNTRAQAELWFNALIEVRPDWSDTLALHHGSLDREVREVAERGLKSGRLRAIVCTSSLDLGVDFSPVERVIQIGSPKGVARLLQRAGRSGHAPGRASRIVCVPTNALELIEIAAARAAVEAGRIEGRGGISKPLDVLAQHLVTCALGGGFEEAELLREVRTTAAYAELSDEEWRWTLDFVVNGGDALRAYPEYRRVVEKNGRFVVEDRDIARRHRLSVGTIVSDAAILVQSIGGGKLGTVEESFVARLKPGDRFLFAGRSLEFVRVRDMTVYVRSAPARAGATPRWAGSRMPLSTELAASVRERLEEAKYGVFDSPEMIAAAGLLRIQARWSVIPATDELLIERLHDREGWRLTFFPFEGRLVHEGLAALAAMRLARIAPITFSLAANDYGFELLSSATPPVEEALAAGLLSTDGLVEDVIASLNEAELGRRQFREIARVAGLVFGGMPGRSKSARQLQTSSGLLYDVFARFDPDNLLLEQARREVLERQLEVSRLRSALERLARSRLLIVDVERPTPLMFPLIVDRLRETISSEALSDRVERMTIRLERAADAD